MSKKLALLVSLVFLLGLVNTAGAGVYLECDVGDCSNRIQPGWINLPTCGTFEDVGGTPVDVTLTQVGNECSCRGYFDQNSGCVDGPCPAAGPLGDVEQDFLFGDDCEGPPDGDFIITFSDLTPGAPYVLRSYHSRLDENTTYIQRVQVSGATDVQTPGQIAQCHASMENPAEISFTATGTEVAIHYVAPPEGDGGSRKGKGAQVFLNGFIFEGGLPDVAFELESSEDVENVTPAEITVVLSRPESVPVTADYAVTGGTAIRGEDFILEDGTLTFEAGERFKTITIDIIDDGEDEENETIEITLSNVAGGQAILGLIPQHIYTIIDPRPEVQFAAETSETEESKSPAFINVSLTHEWTEPVSVDYATIGGGTTTAGADYLQASGTLTFHPGQVSKAIAIDLVDDGLKEDPETIILELSNPVEARLGTPIQHTATIRDPWPTEFTEMLKVDLGCPGNPATLKEGWTPWDVPDGCDGELHDGRTINDIAGTGINVYCGVYNDSGGNMSAREGDPITNTAYFMHGDGRGHTAASMRLNFTGLDAGVYALYTYHSWSGFDNMPSATVTGDAVIEIQGAVNVPVQDTALDDELVPSEVRFYTDGSGPVKVVYEAAENSRACVNAFSLHSAVTAVECPCPGDLAEPVGQVDLRDLDAMVNMLVDAGPPFIVPVEAGHCADMAEPTGQVDLQDLDALVNLLVNAGPPFIVPCE